MATPEVESTIDAPPKAPDDLAEPGPGGHADAEWRQRIYRLSVRQFLRAVDVGVLDDARVELLGGLLFRQLGTSRPHDYASMALAAAIRPLLPSDWLMLCGLPVQLGRRNRPIVDLAIVRGPASRHKGWDPQASDVALIVEVADRSYRFDRGFRYRRYAAARVPALWIVNLALKQVEVYRNPTGSGPGARFEQCEVHGLQGQVAISIAGIEVGQVAVGEVIS